MTTARDLHQDAALVVIGSPQWAGELELREPPGPEATLLVLDRQGNAIAFSGKVEYGQGIRSGFTLAIADELDLPLASVQVILGDTDLVPYDRGTTGSVSTRTVGIQLRRAAATARQALIALAAQRWEMDEASLGTSDGYVFQTGELSQTVRYADLLQGQSLRLAIPEDTTTKDAEGFLFMGRDAPRTDALDRGQRPSQVLAGYRCGRDASRQNPPPPFLRRPSPANRHRASRSRARPGHGRTRGRLHRCVVRAGGYSRICSRRDTGSLARRPGAAIRLGPPRPP